MFTSSTMPFAVPMCRKHMGVAALAPMVRSHWEPTCGMKVGMFSKVSMLVATVMAYVKSTPDSRCCPLRLV